MYNCKYTHIFFYLALRILCIFDFCCNYYMSVFSFHNMQRFFFVRSYKKYLEVFNKCNCDRHSPPSFDLLGPVGRGVLRNDIPDIHVQSWTPQSVQLANNYIHKWTVGWRSGLGPIVSYPSCTHTGQSSRTLDTGKGRGTIGLLMSQIIVDCVSRNGCVLLPDIAALLAVCPCKKGCECISVICHELAVPSGSCRHCIIMSLSYTFHSGTLALFYPIEG